VARKKWEEKVTEMGGYPGYVPRQVSRDDWGRCAGLFKAKPGDKLTLDGYAFFPVYRNADMFGWPAVYSAMVEDVGTAAEWIAKGTSEKMGNVSVGSAPADLVEKAKKLAAHGVLGIIAELVGVPYWALVAALCAIAYFALEFVGILPPVRKLLR
jgi:hypothetical protein